MASLLITGKGDQKWVNRSAREREFSRTAGAFAFASLALNIILVAAIIYVAALPREKAVVIAQQRDGSYAPYSEAGTPDEAGKKKLLADWVADWRVGLTDPTSLAARQTAALVSNRPGSDVATQVRDYNQQVADGSLTVVPTVRSVTCSGADCEMDWDETVTSGTKVSQHAMRAYATIGFDDANLNLHDDPLTNPYGMYLQKLRVVEIGVNHAH